MRGLYSNVEWLCQLLVSLPPKTQLMSAAFPKELQKNGLRTSKRNDRLNNLTSFYKREDLLGRMRRRNTI